MSNIELVTKKEVVFDTRDLKSGRLKFQMKMSDLIGDFYQITISDFYQVDRAMDPNLSEETALYEWRFLNEKTIQKSKDEMDALFSAIRSLIPENLSYSERNRAEKELGFLSYVKSDVRKDGKCIYGLSPDDFEIYRSEN